MLMTFYFVLNVFQSKNKTDEALKNLEVLNPQSIFFFLAEMGGDVTKG